MVKHGKAHEIDIFADTADLAKIEEQASNPIISGFTTNPSLMKQAGLTDYRTFAQRVINLAGGRPVSFEIFADDFPEMERQARVIASWASNVHVKVPITNTRREFTGEMIERLTAEGIKVNVTAIMTEAQLRSAAKRIRCEGCILSVFAGRIADTGRDPEEAMLEAVHFTQVMDPRPLILWASAREVFNVVQAERSKCDIITLTPELIAKLSNFGRDLADYSLDTVRQFHTDSGGFAL